MRRAFTLAFLVVALLVIGAAVVLALWPTPGKYPWLVPGTLVAAGLTSWLIDRGDASSLLIGPLALAILGAPTLAQWFGIDVVTAAFLIGGSLLVLVVLFFSFVFGSPGDDDDDDYP